MNYGNDLLEHKKNSCCVSLFSSFSHLERTSLEMADPKQNEVNPDDQSGLKRERETSEPDNGIKELFISNIPYNVSAVGVETALKRIFAKCEGFKGVRRVNTERGFANVEFDTSISAQKAVENCEQVKLGPRTLNIKLNDPIGSKHRRMARESGSLDQRNTTFAPDTDPNPDCWFCLANPNGDKELIFAVDPAAEVYVSASKGPLTEFHSFVCPVTHFGCYAQATDSVRATCLEYSSKMREVMSRAGKETIIYERWIPLNANAANHMQIHLVPVDKEMYSKADWANLLKQKGKEAGVEFIRIKSQQDVPDKLSGILNKVSYLFFSFPNEHEPECYLGIGKLGFAFPREVICEGLGTPERVDWKACLSDSESQTATIDRLRSLFYPS